MIPPAEPNSTQQATNPGSHPNDSPVDPPDHGFQVVGPALRILQLNVEGMSAAKRDLISNIADKEKIDIVCLQEMHVKDDKANRFDIKGFDLVCHALHPKHGRATYVRSEMTEASHIVSTPHCDVVRIGGYHVANVYKPPSERWDSTTPFLVLPHPYVLVGDFNSHHPDWGYQESDPMVTSCKTGHRATIFTSFTTPHGEAPSIRHGGSVIALLTCAGSQQLVVTPNQPRVKSWMTSRTANTARL